MSGPEVLGAMSALTAIVRASIDLYGAIQKDLRLPEAFSVVQWQLPIILASLKTAEQHLKAVQDAISTDAWDALEEYVVTCKDKADRLKQIFEKVLPASNDTWKDKYKKMLKRFGKGSLVEELMLAITEDVKLLRKHHALATTNPEQREQLDTTVEELKNVGSSLDDGEQASGMRFDSGGGKMENYINQRDGNQVINHGTVTNQNFVANAPREDFHFRGPKGIHLGQAPSIQPELFIGRSAELDEMNRLLHPDDGSDERRVLVLGAMGGFGKTQLAIAYARQPGHRYKSIFWLNATSEATLKDSFRRIANQIFEVQDPKVLEGEQSQIKTCNWFADPRNRDWLLIYDNHDDPKTFRIEDYYPDAQHGSIIVTTRRPDLVIGTEFLVKCLSDLRSSLEVLATRSGRKQVESVPPDQAAKDLVKRLDNLPLALATAGAYLRASKMTFKQYLEEYGNRWNVNPNRPANLVEYHDRTLYTTWNISYARLRESNERAARLLGLLAYFDHQHISGKLLRAGLKHDTPAWIQDILNDFINFDGDMAVLVDYCFIDNLPDTQIWSMHTCIHDWTLASLHVEIDPEQYWYAFSSVGNYVDGLSSDEQRHPSQAPLVAHAEHLKHQRFRQHTETNKLREMHLSAATAIGMFLYVQGRYTQAERMFWWVFKDSQDQKMYLLCTATALQFVGYIHRIWDDLKAAEKTLILALSWTALVQHEDHVKKQLAIESELAKVYQRQHKYDRSEQLRCNSLTAGTKLWGPSHSSSLTAMVNLGSFYASRGKYTEAEKFFLDALDIQRRTHGRKHYSTMETIRQLGQLYRDWDRNKEAKECFREAYEYFVNLEGPNAFSSLQALSFLGTTHRRLKDYNSAEHMLHEAYEGFRALLGFSHIQTQGVAVAIGDLYLDESLLDQAEEWYRKALSNKNESTSSRARYNLSRIYLKQGDLGKAGEACRKALGMGSSIRGRDHPETAKSLKHLARIYQRQGRLDEGKKLLLEVLAVERDCYGPSHEYTIDTVADLGDIHERLGELPDLIALASSWGDSVPRLLNCLGRLLLQKTDEAEALVAFRCQLVLKDDTIVFDDLECALRRCERPLDVESGRAICRQCDATVISVDICFDCLQDHLSGADPVDDCVGHQYFEIVKPAAISGEQITPMTKPEKDYWLQQLAKKYPADGALSQRTTLVTRRTKDAEQMVSKSRILTRIYAHQKVKDGV